MKSLQHSFPKRYSWISVIFLVPFHKLANAHEKLRKRYGKFHIEKHAVSYLDGQSWPKVKYLLSMKDFDTSNEFFYHDIISGLTELSIAYLQYENKSPNTHISLQSIDARDLIQFCDEHSAYNPSLKIVSDYLHYDGLTVLGLLEAQKFGDFNLDMLFTKILDALQFTTRGIKYGPALVYHLLEMAVETCGASSS